MIVMIFGSFHEHRRLILEMGLFALVFAHLSEDRILLEVLPMRERVRNKTRRNIPEVQLLYTHTSTSFSFSASIRIACPFSSFICRLRGVRSSTSFASDLFRSSILIFSNDGIAIACALVSVIEQSFQLTRMRRNWAQSRIYAGDVSTKRWLTALSTMLCKR